MKFIAEILVMPHKELLDPQGKTVANNMKNLDIQGVEDIRIGKHIVIKLEAQNQSEADQKIKIACEKLLANPIMENYQYTLSPA
jgi:phosphoribosylformylglycinamidine synthase subunit PurS